MKLFNTVFKETLGIERVVIMSARGMVILLCAVLVSGCAGRSPAKKIETGERVKIEYQCSIPDKGLVDTNMAAVAQDIGIKKSRAFEARDAYKPLELIAGKDQPGQVSGDLKYLIPEIRTKLAYVLVGKMPGRTYDAVLETTVPEGMEDSHRYIKKDRISIIPKIKKIKHDDYARDTKSEPVVGKVFSEDGHPYAEVAAVDDQYVSLRLIVDESYVYDVPWGKAHDKDNGDTVLITYENEIGALVKTGPVLGRVIEVNEDKIVIDYGHPFAGYALSCKVKILSLEQGAK